MMPYWCATFENASRSDRELALAYIVMHKYASLIAEHQLLERPYVQYEGRNSYYNALERSQAKNEDRIFLQRFIKKYLKEHRRRYLR